MKNIRKHGSRFIYLYFNRNEPDKIRELLPAHVEYWKTADLKEYMGGPFGDRTGGLISFIASDLEEAREIIFRDPFLLKDLIAERWIKEWSVE